MRLQRVEALEVEERFDQPRASRIAIKHRHEIGAESHAQFAVFFHRLREGPHDDICTQSGMPATRPNACDHRSYQTIIFKHRFADEPRHRKIAVDDGLCVRTNALPDGIDDLDTGGGTRNMAHG